MQEVVDYGVDNDSYDSGSEEESADNKVSKEDVEEDEAAEAENPRNVMGRSNSTGGMLSWYGMDNLLHEIVQFKNDHEAPVTYKSTNSKKITTLMGVSQIDKSHFLKKAKSRANGLIKCFRVAPVATPLLLV